MVDPKTVAMEGPQKNKPNVLSGYQQQLETDPIYTPAYPKSDPLKKQKENEENTLQMREQMDADLLQDLGGSEDLVTVPTGTVDAALASQNAPQQQIGSKSRTTTSSAAPKEVVQQQLAGLQIEAQAGAAQLDARALGYELQTNLYQDLKLKQQEQIYPILQAVSQIFDDADRQLQGIQEMVDDVRANRIQPGQFFANIGDAGTFAASMAIAAGHLASSMGGGPNTALSVINGAIERNMRAQELNQAHDRAVLQANIQIFDRMRALGVDRLNQANVYNALLLSQAQSALEGIAAATASVETRAQIGILQGQIVQRKADALLKFYGTQQSTVKMKVFAAQSAAQQSAQADKEQMVGSVITNQLSGIQPSIEEYRKILTGDVVEGKISRAEAEQQMAQFVESLPDAVRKNALNALQQKGAQNPGQILTDDEIRHMTTTNPLFQGAETQDFRPAERGKVISVGDKKFRTTEEFDALPKEGPQSQARMAAGFRFSMKLVRKWQRLYELLPKVTAFGGSGGTLGKLFFMNEQGQVRFKGGPNTTPEQTQMAQEFSTLLTDIVITTKRAQSGGHMEAMQNPREFAVWQLQALIPTDVNVFTSKILGGDVRDLVAPVLRNTLVDVYEEFKPFVADLKDPRRGGL